MLAANLSPNIFSSSLYCMPESQVGTESHQPVPKISSPVSCTAWRRPRLVCCLANLRSSCASHCIILRIAGAGWYREPPTCPQDTFSSVLYGMASSPVGQLPGQPALFMCPSLHIPRIPGAGWYLEQPTCPQDTFSSGLYGMVLSPVGQLPGQPALFMCPSLHIQCISGAGWLC